MAPTLPARGEILNLTQIESTQASNPDARRFPQGLLLPVAGALGQHLDEAQPSPQRLPVLVKIRIVRGQSCGIDTEAGTHRANDLFYILQRKPSWDRVIDDARRDLRIQDVKIDMQVDLRPTLR